MLCLKGSDEVDALLDGADWCDLMVHLHGLDGRGLAGGLSTLVHEWSVEVLSLTLVSGVVGGAGHDTEFIVPSLGHLDVFLD